MADELRMAAIFREDCPLPPGKMAAQAGHAFATALWQHPDEGLCQTYMENGQAKLVLIAPNLETLFKIAKRAKDRGVSAAMIKDQGRTVLNEPTFTVLGLGPMDRNSYNNLTRGLKLAE